MAIEPASGSTSLLDEARALTVKKGPPCDVDRLFTYRPDLAAEIREAIASEVDATAIAAALKRRGLEIGPNSIARHRRKACQCQS